MQETRLQNDEIETLLEALKAWEDKDATHELLDGVMESMLGAESGGRTPEKVLERRERRAREKKHRQEASVLLQAKLIQMRNAADVDTFIAGALRSG